MKLKKQILKIILLVLLIMPTSVLAYSKAVIPGGQTIGIEVNSSGILVVGFYPVDNKYIAKDAGFKVGDIITKVNNTKVNNITDMVNVINANSNKPIKFNVLRKSTGKEATIKLELENTEILKTGLYVKDKINGVGTLSYIDPKTKIFGSLGHEIIENATASKFEIKDGKIYEASVSSITRSKVGSAGEKNASYDKEEIYGSIKENTEVGIYGTYTENITNETAIEVAEKNTVTTGKASIRTVIHDNIVEDFDINIIRLNENSKTKNILFEITDNRLLAATGGIIQGMSGSPIIQNNKLIGAVNYVIVNDPKKGYGIFITTMLEEGEN